MIIKDEEFNKLIAANNDLADSLAISRRLQELTNQVITSLLTRLGGDVSIEVAELKYNVKTYILDNQIDVRDLSGTVEEGSLRFKLRLR